MSVFARRLREARLRKGLSQERLGVLAGIDEATASARMNHYEGGRHEPNWLTVERLAEVLEVPVAFLYATDDSLAELLAEAHALSPDQRRALIAYAKELKGVNAPPEGDG